ncbi:immune-associated nucleotide-binding protein 5-like [Perca flavescens]|uniref:immune-associated nucleotide-binding protein 5-like n=1 Tax=Perca flavescens TaxID=8167 RepID=UPI00106E627A|nr:immune-associated nucleotide-binding protein 5-like [Perca flavescens]
MGQSENKETSPCGEQDSQTTAQRTIPKLDSDEAEAEPNSVSKNVWIKLTGPAAVSLAQALYGPTVVVLQENKGARRGAGEIMAEEDNTAIRLELEAEGAEVTGRGGTTAIVKTVSVPPTRTVVAGTAQAGKRIKVLKTYRIVLLGKTQAGKSSLANTIFGDDVFKINHTSIYGTSECQAGSKSVHGRRLTVVDTPGFFDTDRPEQQLKSEIVRCITEYAPGPHAFFIVLKVEKFTENKQAVFTKICQYFSDEALKYAAVVFTHGDQLPEGMKIEQFVDQNKCLSDLVKKCGGRCHVVDNKYWKNNQQDEYRSNKFQVAELLNTTDKIVMENKGGCYTNKMLPVWNEKEEENNRTSGGKMPQGHPSNKANKSVSKNVWLKLTGPAAESLVESFCGPGVVVLQQSGGLTKGAEEGIGSEEGEVYGGAVEEEGEETETEKEKAGEETERCSEYSRFSEYSEYSRFSKYSEYSRFSEYSRCSEYSEYSRCSEYSSVDYY